MKLFLSFAAGLLISAQALAQDSQRYEAMCLKGESLVEIVTEFGEQASLTMISVRKTPGGQAEIPAVLFINYETKSWTLVERVDNDRFCVIATGENIKPYIKK